MFRFEEVMYRNILTVQHLLLPANKVTCIVGESGSGKTTLLRLLNKMISPDSGTVYYYDTPLHSIPAVQLRRKVVMLPQNPVIFPGSIEENLQAGLRFAEKPAATNEQLQEILTQMCLPKKLQDNAGNLSGGEKQRLALGRMLLLSPEVLLLDEPSSALDAETEQLIIGSIVDYSRSRSRTLIMVTHARQVSGVYAQQIVTMRAGSITHVEEAANNAGDY